MMFQSFPGISVNELCPARDIKLYGFYSWTSSLLILTKFSVSVEIVSVLWRTHLRERKEVQTKGNSFSCVLILQREVYLHYNNIYHKTLNYIVLRLSVKAERDLWLDVDQSCEIIIKQGQMLLVSLAWSVGFTKMATKYWNVEFPTSIFFLPVWRGMDQKKACAVFTRFGFISLPGRVLDPCLGIGVPLMVWIPDPV